MMFLPWIARNSGELGPLLASHLLRQRSFGRATSDVSRMTARLNGNPTIEATSARRRHLIA